MMPRSRVKRNGEKNEKVCHILGKLEKGEARRC